jgi:hypothetical protein
MRKLQSLGGFCWHLAEVLLVFFCGWTSGGQALRKAVRTCERASIFPACPGGVDWSFNLARIA